MQGLFPPVNTGAAARRYEPPASRRAFPAVRGRAGSEQPQPGRAGPGSGRRGASRRRRSRRYRPGTRVPPGGRQAARSSRERVKGRWRGRPAAGSEHVQSAAASGPRASGAAALRLPPPAAGRPWSPVRRWGRGGGDGAAAPARLPRRQRPAASPRPGARGCAARGGRRGLQPPVSLCWRRERDKGGRRGPGLREGAATPGAPPPRLASPRGARGAAARCWGRSGSSRAAAPCIGSGRQSRGVSRTPLLQRFQPKFSSGEGKNRRGAGGWPASSPRVVCGAGRSQTRILAAAESKESSSFFNLSRCQGGCSCSVFGTENAFRMAEFLQDGKPESFRPSFAQDFTSCP